MKQLNKHVLIAMNPKSTTKDLRNNASDASDAYADAAYNASTYDSAFHASAYAYYAAKTASTDAYYVAVYADYAIDATEKHLNKFLEFSGHKLEDYNDEIERINKDEQLNKYVLIAMNPKTTIKDLCYNAGDASDAYADAASTDAYAVVSAVSSYAYYASCASCAFYDDKTAIADSADAYAEKYLNKFLKLSGHKLEDYNDEIERINKDR